MKKILLAACVLLMSGSMVMAQSHNERQKGTVTKKGQYILPQKGDYGLGISATPMLEFTGNMFNGNNWNQAPGFEGVEDLNLYTPSIYGKYFLKDNQAVRVRLTLGFGNDRSSFIIQDDANSSDPDATVKDFRDVKTNAFSLSGGYEWRRGYGRLQGFWGADMTIGMSNQVLKYSYGNDFSSSNTTPTSVSNWGTGATGSASSRVLKNNAGTNFFVGAGAFVGVEFFIAPKISIGGEFYAGVYYNSLGYGKSKTESWDSVNSKVVTETTNWKDTQGGSRSSSFHFKTLATGNAFFMFYF